MNFRYFDSGGRQVTPEQLHAMDITTPAIEHVFASVVERIVKPEKQSKEIENCVSDCYN